MSNSAGAGFSTLETSKGLRFHQSFLTLAKPSEHNSQTHQLTREPCRQNVGMQVGTCVLCGVAATMPVVYREMRQPDEHTRHTKYQTKCVHKQMECDTTVLWECWVIDPNLHIGNVKKKSEKVRLTFRCNFFRADEFRSCESKVHKGDWRPLTADWVIDRSSGTTLLSFFFYHKMRTTKGKDFQRLVRKWTWDRKL